MTLDSSEYSNKMNNAHNITDTSVNVVLVDNSCDIGDLNDTQRTQSETGHENMLAGLSSNNQSLNDSRRFHHNGDKDFLSSNILKSQDQTIMSEEPQVTDIDEDDS